MRDISCVPRAPQLSADDRELFARVRDSIFANPFAADRIAADARIAGVDSFAGVAEDERLARVLAQVTPRLHRLEAAGLGRVDAFTGADRTAIESAWLFQVFHRHVRELDLLIDRQAESPEAPVKVAFASDLVGELVRKGFRRAEALHYLALFHQLRRAYDFIERGLVGRSPAMTRLRRALWNAVFTHDIGLYDRWLHARMEDFSTLLLGETGTGKGAAAAAIGRSGLIPFDEKKQTFVETWTLSLLSINLLQFPQSLVESELFGHAKGAFTGAISGHVGILSRVAPHGALFLDEVGEIPVTLQIKLLQVLQERTFSAVGSHSLSRFRGRVIAATNKPKEHLRGDDALRNDFFYRLSSDVIDVPSLRERLSEDPGELDDLIALLVGRTIGAPSPEVVALIRAAIDRDLPRDYAWPGNVRELEQAVRRILLTGSYRGNAEHVDASSAAALARGIEAGTMTAAALLAGYCRLLHGRHGNWREVARRLDLDQRTVKKYVEDAD